VQIPRLVSGLLMPSQPFLLHGPFFFPHARMSTPLVSATSMAPLAGLAEGMAAARPAMKKVVRATVVNLNCILASWLLWITALVSWKTCKAIEAGYLT